MSQFGPTGDDPDDNPFKGMPLFEDLARMMRNQGPVAWQPAQQVALSTATGGSAEPNVDPLERMNLEQLARVAELHVNQYTGWSVTVNVRPVTRTQWATRTLDDLKPLFEQLASTLSRGSADDAAAEDLDGLAANDPVAFLAPLMQMIEPVMLGMTAGSMVGHLARRSFGQYDVPLPRPGNDIMLVPATIAQFGDDWSLPHDDLRLWICLHEIAHHATLAVPHIRARLQELIAAYLAGFRADPHALENRLGELDVSSAEGLASMQTLFADPEVLLGAVQTAEQRALLPRLEALVAVLVGWVDHVMDEVGSSLIPSYGQLTEALRRHRVEADPSDRFVERLFGLELTQAHYERGGRFIDGVVERAGTDGLERLWLSERELPTPNEVDAPGLWLARIDLPDDPD